MKVWSTVLSVLGGVSGIISGLLVTTGGVFTGDDAMGSAGAAVFWLSILAIAVGFIAWTNKPILRKICGLFMIFFAFYGFVTNGLFFIIAFIFSLIAGIMILRWKVNTT